MAITDPAEITRLINNPAIAAAKLAAAVVAGDSKIYALTNRKDWTITDTVFGELANIGSLWGAWTILVSYDSEEYLNKAKEIRAAFEDAVADFRKIPLPESKSDPQFTIATSDYTITKLNADIVHFLSDY